MKKKKSKGSPKAAKPEANGLHPEKPKLLPVQLLIQAICKDHHTKGVLAR